MKHQELEVRVLCGDSNIILEEYCSKVEADNGMTCFLPSELGKTFQLAVTNSSSTVDFALFLSLDGKVVSKKPVYRGKTTIIEDMAVSRDTRRPFMFSQLKLTDDENAIMPTLNTLANIGAITLQCHRVAKFGKATPYELKQVDLGMKEIPETAKKAGAHKISLGAARAITSVATQMFLKDSIDKPYATFCFQYRPKEMLQAQGIMPLDVVGVTVVACGPKRSRREFSPAPRQQSGLPSPSKRIRTEPLSPTSQARRGISSPAERYQSPSQKDSRPTVKPEDAEVIEDLEARRAAAMDQIRELEVRLEIARSQGDRVKREPSPIRLGGPSGEVIDRRLD